MALVKVSESTKQHLADETETVQCFPCSGTGCCEHRQGLQALEGKLEQALAQREGKREEHRLA